MTRNGYVQRRPSARRQPPAYRSRAWDNSTLPPLHLRGPPIHATWSLLHLPTNLGPLRCLSAEKLTQLSNSPFSHLDEMKPLPCGAPRTSAGSATGITFPSSLISDRKSTRLNS